MATNTELLVSKNKGLRAKVETVEGAREVMDNTHNIPITDLDWPLNHETQDSSEANFSLDEGPSEVIGSKPEIKGTCLLRGGKSGDVTVAPPYDPLMQACAYDPTNETVLPASGSADVTSGTTRTFVVDAAAEGLPTDPAVVAKFSGRPVKFDANPSSGIALIAAASIAGGNISVTLDRILGSALGATTDLKLLACRVYRLINTGIKSASLDCFLDGKLQAFVGARGSVQLQIDGRGQGKLVFSLKAAFDQDLDAALPTIGSTISSLPPAPRWEDGDAYCDGVPVAVTSFDYNLQADTGQHRDPNQAHGLLPARQTGRKARGTIQFNTVTKATKDWLAKVEANEEMTFSAVLNKNGAVGTRIALMLPRMKFLGESYADFEGFADTSRPYQAINGGTITIF